MAMAHPVPGLGKRKVTRHHQPFRRVTSAPPDIVRLRQILRPLHPEKIDSIRNSARQSWQAELGRNSDSVTTYNGLHAMKELDEPTQNRVRPSSRDRQNKPHPPNVFLVTRLKKVSGCLSPNEAASKKYGGTGQGNLDQYVSEHKHEIRRAMGASPLQRPHTSSVTDRERVNMQTMMGSVPAQAAEAWIKLSSEKDKNAIRKTFKEAEDKIKKDLKAAQPPTNEQYLNYKRQYPTLRSKIPQNKEVFSSHRWMKRAGQAESENVQNLIEALRNAPPRFLPNQGPHFHITDYSPMFASAPREPFYDFQIHPEWHMPWHKKYAVKA